MLLFTVKQEAFQQLPGRYYLAFRQGDIFTIFLNDINYLLLRFWVNAALGVIPYLNGITHYHFTTIGGQGLRQDV